MFGEDEPCLVFISTSRCLHRRRSSRDADTAPQKPKLSCVVFCQLLIAADGTWSLAHNVVNSKNRNCFRFRRRYFVFWTRYRRKFVCTVLVDVLIVVGLFLPRSVLILSGTFSTLKYLSCRICGCWQLLRCPCWCWHCSLLCIQRVNSKFILPFCCNVAPLSLHCLN